MWISFSGTNLFEHEWMQQFQQHKAIELNVVVVFLEKRTRTQTHKQKINCIFRYNYSVVGNNFQAYVCICDIYEKQHRT